MLRVGGYLDTQYGHLGKLAREYLNNLIEGPLNPYDRKAFARKLTTTTGDDPNGATFQAIDMLLEIIEYFWTKYRDREEKQNEKIEGLTERLAQAEENIEQLQAQITSRGRFTEWSDR